MILDSRLVILRRVIQEKRRKNKMKRGMMNYK
jgi:hypothetical protein